MPTDEPLYSSTTDLPLWLTSSDKPAFGDPDECSCCDCPCLGATPGLSVSVVGGGDPVCGLADWPFSRIDSWVPDPGGFVAVGCSGGDTHWCGIGWTGWDGGAYAATFGLYYHRVTGHWCSWMHVPICGHAGTDADTCDCPTECIGICPSTDVTGSVECKGGIIFGTFILVGSVGTPFEGYSFRCVIG